MSTAQKKEDRDERTLIESLILLKNLAEQTRMKKISDTAYEDALPKEESVFEQPTQRQYDQVSWLNLIYNKSIQSQKDSLSSFEKQAGSKKRSQFQRSVINQSFRFQRSVSKHSSSLKNAQYAVNESDMNVVYTVNRA